ncbi:MAG: methionyl-tRNA formyltransferase [Dehalococcoidia bacterium]
MSSKTVFMGTPEFAVPALHAMLNGNYDIAAVYTQPDREAGRGRKLSVSPVKELALAHSIQVIQPGSLKDDAAADYMASLAPDVIVVAAYGRLIPQWILSLPEYGCVNIHPSLLPRYRGPSPVATAILEGDSVTGVSIMLLDAGMDSGPLLRQQETTISDIDTTGSLTMRLAETGAKLLSETLPDWIAGKITPEPQDESRATITRIMTKLDGEIDWQLSAQQIWRQVRAFHPWPGTFTRWQGKQLKVNEVLPLPQEKPGQPGRVITLSGISGTTVGVECGQGILGLRKLQLEGKKEITAEEFLRGQRNFAGSILV